jgi:hypothetical protein
MISSASPWLIGTCAESCNTFELLGLRDSQVTEAMFFRSASRKTSSSTHRFIETMRVGLGALSAACASATADSAIVTPMARQECIG